MFCPSCGNQMPDGAKFCPNCGWQVGTGPVAEHGKGVGDYAKGAVSGIADRLNEMAGGTGHVDLKFSNFFDSVAKHHTSEEADELFSCGSPSTTPALQDVASEWPHPWVWSRVLVVLLVYMLLALVMIYLGFNDVGELMFIGSLATPLAALVFFYETNAFRNIGIARVMKYFMLGGMLSLIAIAIILKAFPNISGAGELMPSMFTGLFEEIAKFLIVAILFNKRDGRVPVLNGLLIGAAVGAGFAAFETIGYVLQGFTVDLLITFFSRDDIIQLFSSASPLTAALSADIVAYSEGWASDLIISRGVLAFGGHVAWAAVEGGALALVEGDEGFKWGDLGNTRFLSFAAICIVLHGIWDADVPFLDNIDLGPLGTPKFVLLIIAVWIVLYVLLSRGLEQANELSRKAAEQVAAPFATAGQAPAYAAPAAAPAQPASTNVPPTPPTPPQA